MEGSVRFAIIGDRTGGHIPGYHGSMLEEIERLKPDFVMTVGDMIEGYSQDTSQIIREWEEYLDLVKVLSSPIYYTPGNHDITFDEMEGSYKKYIGSPYHSFSQKGVHVIVLDNSRWNSAVELPEKQISWLKKDLKDNENAAYTIVFMHKPFWYSGIGSDLLHSIFLEHGVDAVFTGHFHNYFSEEYDGILYTSIGSSGGGNDFDPTGLIPYHYAWVTVDKKGIHVAPIKKDSVKPWDLISRQDLHTISLMKKTAIVIEGEIRIEGGQEIDNKEIEVTIYSAEHEFAQIDTIRWDCPPGWKIEPLFAPFEVPAGEQESLKFLLSCYDVIFPCPTLSTKLLFKPETKMTHSLQLPLKRIAYCRPAKKGIKIDGKLKEKSWKKPVSVLYDQDGNLSQIDKTEFFFAYDDDNLYLAAECYESNKESIKSDAMERDGTVYNDDCVGYFIHPGIHANAVFQIYFNPEGIIFDVRFTMNEMDQIIARDIEWDCELQVETSISKDKWVLEAAIPLEQLVIENEPLEEWNINFRRKQQHKTALADWHIPIGTDPGLYGVLVFEK